jgi:hypothetical protein
LKRNYIWGYSKKKSLNTTNLDCIARNGPMVDKLERIWKEAVLAYGGTVPVLVRRDLRKLP